MNLIRISLAVLICFLALSVWGCDSLEPEEDLEPTPEPKIEMEFELIKAGTFEMGNLSGTGRLPWERPVHSVTLTRDFYIGKYEVTRDEYMALMGIDPSFYKGDDRFPVENVSWINAIKFANALSEQDEYPSCYDANGNVIDGGGNPYKCEGYRLPTEAEWEYAARAATKTKWSFGDDIGHLREYARCAGAGAAGPHPVGSLKPNSWDLYDVHGNVKEWVNDWYHGSYYSRSPSVDPQGPEAGTQRVTRGGSWANLDGVRSAARIPFSPLVSPREHNESGIGFRLVRTAE